ncbi:MAG: TonB-dependent receptor [Candidatus Marinimicrobia bacterium]|nr:TonB-dependent receptor [Candidatus Neomarinimicrobiota bacterium]
MALVLLPGLLFPQGRGKIAGTVTDAQTGDPLPGVNVVLTGTSMGAATDEQGDYFIANVPTGEYSLTITMIGYKRTTVKGVKVSMNLTTRIDVSLQQQALESNEVVVVAERPLVEKDKTSTVRIMGSEEIADRPTTNFQQILTSLPSINEENGEMKIRGGTLDEVAFMVDGARVRNPINHDPYTNINLSSIEEVEVITGSFNAEYGEALSGVVNVVTKEGGKDYSFFMDTRYTPPGKKHWGTSLYDRSTTLYWENTHARHQDWWIENTDQWVDNNGYYGYDPRNEWTPEEAYQNYLNTHQPLNNYTETPGYQTEISLGGPVPFSEDLSFFATGKYESEAPLFGNSYRSQGLFYDGNLKLTYKITPQMKINLSSFYGQEKTSWGVGGGPDYFYALNYGVSSRYAYFDFPGLPHSSTFGTTAKFSHTLSSQTLYDIKVSRVQANRSVTVFPEDSIGWQASDATRDNLRAVDSSGAPIPGGYKNRIGYHTTGYFYRYDDENQEWNVSGDLSSQVNKFWQIKTGFDYTYYILDHYNEAKYPTRYDDRIYRPYQGAGYFQNKLEFGGFIMNIGMRLDFYNPNDTVYTNPFDPLNAETKPTETFWQLSPRLGVSHPINEQTVLHFSYGHFFQRANFGDYGEGNSASGAQGSLTTFVVEGSDVPWVLGNRQLEPRKTVAFEVGLERNFFDMFLARSTLYYKDIRNTVRVTTIETPDGVYSTNGNGNYADVRGVELSLRKTPRPTPYGNLWGYLNFTTQRGIDGRSGDPVVRRYDGTVRYAPSGDYIVYNNPRLKAGIYYRTPRQMPFLSSILGEITFSLDYLSVFPNEHLRSDYFLFEGEKYLRPPDQNADLRMKKRFQIGSNNNIALSPYIEVRNVFNNKWIYLGAFESASRADQKKFVESDFEYLPDYKANGEPILDIGKYRNLPREILFGITVQL